MADRTIVARQSIPSSSSSSNTGSHRNSSNSLNSILWTLCATLLAALLLVGLFLVLRRKLRRVYAPRTFHESLEKSDHTPAARKSSGWLQNFKSIDDDFILNHGSLDGYLYLRFFRMLTIMCFVGCCVTWPILFPVNATGGGGESQLDILSFSNINNANRYYAHVFVAWIFLGFVMFMITRETIQFISIRQAYFTSPYYTSRISSRTVLFTSVPGEVAASEEPIRGMFHGVKNVWVPTECDDLQDLVDQRDKHFGKLEKSEIQLISKAIKRREKHQQSNTDQDAENGSNSYLRRDDRPKHKTKPLVGDKVDSIDWSRRQLADILPKIRQEQQYHQQGKKPRLSAAFVEFESLGDAEAAFNLLPYHQPMSMYARQFGVWPDEVIWKNLGMSRAQASVRMIVATAIICVLCLLWGIPTAFVGAVTNISYLTENVPFLGWIDSIPSWALGVVTGLFPTLFLALLMVLVPIICRFLAKQGGLVTLSQVELKTQSWYFAFQVIQVFLITTFTSGAASVASQIVSDPTSAVSLLAKNLPKASNFYISYFILYGVAMSANFLLNPVFLGKIQVLGRIMDKTPRKKWERYMALPVLGWGSVYPKFTNLGVIAISYSCIAPLVLGFATIGMGLLYLVYRHNFLYVYDGGIDTKGAAYARALQQLSVGVYLAEFCLIGLFAIRIGDSSSSVGPLVLMIAFTIGTIVYHIMMRRALGRFTSQLPRNLLIAQQDRDGIKHLDREDKHDESDKSSPNGLRQEGTVDGHASDVGKKERASRWLRPNGQQAHDIDLPRLREAVDNDDCSFLQPCITSQAPKLWLAKDDMEISRAEIEETKRVTGIEGTDDDADFDEKGKVVWHGPKQQSATANDVQEEKVPGS